MCIKNITEYMEKFVSLKFLNTFAINVLASYVVTVYDEYALLKFWGKSFHQDMPVLILGEGSNVLFLENYVGIILLNRIKGIFIAENKDYWKLHVGAGEKWNDLVIFTLNNNMPGLENLACIPGYVGAAPIQNIGAYGVELSQICEYVDVLDLRNGNRIRFTAVECNFQYRDSIFKQYVNKYVIIFVGLRLHKHWKPTLRYHKLACLNSARVTPYQIFNLIYVMRKKKLPNPKIFGNAGSFFKNPIVDVKVAQSLLQIYPDIPHFLQKDNKIKLSAGWLIEHCQLKGYVLGEAAVYYKQALVLVNVRQIATGTEIAALAFYIYKRVLHEFNICLQPEVRFMGNIGELNPKKLFM